MAYDVMSGSARIIGYGADRNYGTLGTFEIVGSADVVGDENGVARIVDWKTGFKDVEPAAQNAQLAFYALSYARAMDLTSARVSIVYTNTGRVDEAQLDALDLDVFATKLRVLHRHVAALQADPPAHPNTVEGRWCAYCPCKHVCPSKNALLVQVASQGLAAIGDAEMTPRRATLAYQELVRVEDLVRDARKRLNTYVDDHGSIDLGNGRAFGRYVRAGNERLDGAVAAEVIQRAFGPDPSTDAFIRHAIEFRTSKAAIERACKTSGAPRGTAPMLIRHIRELGGSSNAPETMPLGEYQTDVTEPAPALDIDAVNLALKAINE
jgi:hypothetical protein